MRLFVVLESVKQANNWAFFEQSLKIYFSSVGPHSDEDAGSPDAVTYTDVVVSVMAESTITSARL